MLAEYMKHRCWFASCAEFAKCFRSHDKPIGENAFAHCRGDAMNDFGGMNVVERGDWRHGTLAYLRRALLNADLRYDRFCSHPQVDMPGRQPLPRTTRCSQQADWETISSPCSDGRCRRPMATRPVHQTIRPVDGMYTGPT